MPYISDKSNTRVSVSRILSFLRLKIKSKKFFMFIENDLTFDIMRYPIKTNEMY